MNSTKTENVAHTAGPWGIEWTEQRAWIGPMRKGGDGKIDRIVCSTEREGLVPESLAEKDANARLIAAAPDLLAACKAALVYNPVPLVEKAIRAAIAKAEQTNVTQ